MTGLMLNIRDAAEYIGWDRHKVGRWIAAGKIPVVRDPDSGRPWIPRASLDRWLAEQHGVAS